MNAPEILAAGAVLWRRDTEGVQVALIHRPKYDDWTFPKGKMKIGEHVLRAAHREVCEETGFWPILGRRLPSTSYLKNGRSKRVDYWAATPAPGRHPDELGGDEVDRLEWMSVAAAEDRLSYDRDVTLLRELATGPGQTVPVILLRHAKAIRTLDWPDHDMLRPLDVRGRSQAAELAGLLASFGPATVVSSSTARCVETMLPYINREGVSIMAEPAFTSGAAKPGRLEQRVDELLEREVPTIVCSHDDIVAEMVSLACVRLGTEPPTDPHLRKGGFWVLHVADNRLAGIDQYRTQN